MEYRNRGDIVRSFLLAALHGSVQSEIMAKAILSASEFETVVSDLSSSGLIAILRDRASKYKAYKITPAGLKYLSYEQQIK